MANDVCLQGEDFNEVALIGFFLEMVSRLRPEDEEPLMSRTVRAGTPLPRPGADLELPFAEIRVKALQAAGSGIEKLVHHVATLLVAPQGGSLEEWAALDVELDRLSAQGWELKGPVQLLRIQVRKQASATLVAFI